jgi:integrase
VSSKGSRRTHVLVHLLATTGLRISEAIALAWRNVQLDGSEPHITVRRAWVREQFGPPKSEHGRRTVPIPHQRVVALRQHRARNPWATDDDLVFAHSGAPRLDPRRRREAVLRPENLRRALRPLAQEADVPWLGFHAFRHAFASMLIDDGRNIVQISRLLGHHSHGFTLGTYAHLMDDAWADRSGST